jgi:hypothetical protein
VDTYTIFNRPADYPHDEFVVRLFKAHATGVETGRVVGTALTLNEARRLIPPGLIRLPRFEGDQPAIVEVWL